MHTVLQMEVRLSPYNSPFIPHHVDGVYWLGREFQDVPHNAHVHCFMRSNSVFGQRYLQPELCTLWFDFKVQAAGKRLGYL